MKSSLNKWIGGIDKENLKRGVNIKVSKDKAKEVFDEDDVCISVGDISIVITKKNGEWDVFIRSHD